MSRHDDGLENRARLQAVGAESTVKTALAVVLFVLGGVAVVFSLYGMGFHLTIGPKVRSRARAGGRRARAVGRMLQRFLLAERQLGQFRERSVQLEPLPASAGADLRARAHGAAQRPEALALDVVRVPPARRARGESDLPALRHHQRRRGRGLPGAPGARSTVDRMRGVSARHEGPFGARHLRGARRSQAALVGHPLRARVGRRVRPSTACSIATFPMARTRGRWPSSGPRRDRRRDLRHARPAAAGSRGRAARVGAVSCTLAM